MSQAKQELYLQLYLKCLEVSARADHSVKEWHDIAHAQASELCGYVGLPGVARVSTAAPNLDPAAMAAGAVAEVGATVFGPAFKGWPAPELERILVAAQHWSMGKEMNASEEQFADAERELMAKVEELAVARIAMKG
jgi:hypothetical protein